jgi:hypothetical protein
MLLAQRVEAPSQLANQLAHRRLVDEPIRRGDAHLGRRLASCVRFWLTAASNGHREKCKCSSTPPPAAQPEPFLYTHFLLKNSRSSIIKVKASCVRRTHPIQASTASPHNNKTAWIRGQKRASTPPPPQIVPRKAADSRSARSTRTTKFNQQIPTGILLGFPPLHGDPRIQRQYGHTAGHII